VRGAYRDYQQQRRQAIEAGRNPDAMLSRPVHTRVTGSGATRLTQTDNPVRQSFDEVGRVLGAVAPARLVRTALGAMVLLVGPLAFATWGVVFATYDYSNKTVKLKAARGSWPLVILAKAIANAATVTVVLGVALAITEVTARVFNWYVTRSLPDATAYVAQARSAVPPGSLAEQYAVAVFVAVVFSTIGFCGGILFRRALVPLAIVAIYNLFIPSLGRYDLKNATAVTVRGVFSFGSDLEVLSPTPPDPRAAAGVLVAVLAAAVVISLAAARGQSKFVT